MRRASLPIVTFMLASVFMSAQSPTPFKLGTFDNGGRTFVGIVLRESVVIDFAAAHQAIPVSGKAVAAPVDMKDLIVRYESGVRSRIAEIIRDVEQAGAMKAPYVHDLAAVKVLPPIMYPTTMLNVAVNYARARPGDGQLREQVPPVWEPATSGVGAAGDHERPGHLGARRWRCTVESLHVHEVAGGDHRDGEAIRLAAGAHAGGLGM